MAFLKDFCLPFTKFSIKKIIQSTKQAEADQTVSPNHADAYPNVGITHTSNHFANQLTFLPEAPIWDPFKEELYI